VTIRIAEQAFRILKSTLGGIGRDSGATVLEDGVVRISIDAGRIISAGYDDGFGPGMFSGMQRQSHAAGGDLTETIDIYSPGTVIAPLDLVTPPDFDWWFLGVACNITSTTQTSIDECQFGFLSNATAGWSDGTVLGNESVLARWDLLVATAGGGIKMVNSLNGQNFQAPPFAVRWSRNMLIRVSSQTTGAGASAIDYSSFWSLGRRGLHPSAF